VPRTLVLDTHIRESASEIHPEEVAVAHAASVRPDLVEGSWEIWRASSTSFTWSPVKLRRACFYVSAAAARRWPASGWRPPSGDGFCGLAMWHCPSHRRCFAGAPQMIHLCSGLIAAASSIDD
jgi:hypothetical protein